MRARELRDAGLVAATRLTLSALVFWGGFRAVSDDDFARIVHAQEFVSSPALDPTGTSWLPFPFWLGGGVMMVFGTSVSVARALALALGVVSSLLLLAAARLFIDNKDGALAGALLATAIPWSVRLGVATVPELLAAALSVFGLATLRHPEGKLRSGGAVALTVACLCRYEPWLLAATFAGYTALDAWRAPRARAGFVLASAVALAGPLGWLLHNAQRHGDALHFLARVSAYKRAVGGVPASLWALVEGYPLALLREEPELCATAVVLVVAGRGVPVAFRRAGLSVVIMVVALSLASLPGGAPTHHVGRAVLAVWLLLAIAVGEGSRCALRSSRRWAFAAWVLAVMPLGAWVLRPWYARLDSFITRDEEVLIGSDVAPLLTRERALVEAVDYGYFAIQAGSGRPERVLLDRSVDPRDVERPSSFTSGEAIRRRAAELDATVVLGHLSAATRELGAPFATRGAWGAWVVTPRRSVPPRPR